ncbi:MAG: MFS transporter [bacterium]|nr:MFS transporter [bacterium]
MKFILLHIIVFLSGFSLMGYEILGSRILAPYFGSSVYVWGAIISVFMLGLSIGYPIGGAMADKRGKVVDIAWTLLCSIIFIFAVSFIGRTVCQYFSNIDLNIRYSALLVSMILFLFPCICLGIISPYLVKLATNSQNKVGRRVGSIYCVSTIGSIIGTLFVSFYLITLIGTSNGVRILCIPLLLALIVSLLFGLVNKYSMCNR